MTWLKIDDGFCEHPKVVGLSDEAFRLWFGLAAYSSRYLTDGIVPGPAVALLVNQLALAEVARRFVDADRDTKRDISGTSAGHERDKKRLLRVLKRYTDGVTELDKNRLISVRSNGAIRIHDFLDYNPSKQQVLAERSARAERLRRYRERRRNAVRNGVRNGVTEADVTPPPARPGPSPSTKELRPLGPRKRDPIWEGLLEAMACEPQTKNERGKWNAAAKQLRDIGVDSASEVVRRAAVFRRKYERASLTPTAIANRWGELNGSTPNGSTARPRTATELLEDMEAESDR